MEDLFTTLASCIEPAVLTFCGVPWVSINTFASTNFGPRRSGMRSERWQPPVTSRRTGTTERAIAVIDEAPFLLTQQKRDIFYNNAARFLRLSREDIARHHSF